MTTTILHGDCLDTFKSVRGLASIVTDPPGGGAFMGLAFDGARGGRDAWIKYMAARFKVAREATVPGSWGLVWAFGRTAHWTAAALDDAGWEIVRPVLHVHGQGWPKADSQLKPAQEIWWLVRWGPVTPLQIDRCRVRRSWAERSEAWFRSGHTSKPDAQKIGGAPPGQGIEINAGGSWPPDLVLSHCGACRCVGVRSISVRLPGGQEGAEKRGMYGPTVRTVDYEHRSEKRTDCKYMGTETVPAWECLAACECGLASLAPAGGAPSACPGCSAERWWACPVAEMDGQSGERRSAYPGNPTAALKYAGTEIDTSRSRVMSPTVGSRAGASFADSGGGSRFFPCFHYDAKASRAERQGGCEGLLWVRDKKAGIGWRRVRQEEYDRAPAFVMTAKGKKPAKATGNVHATIKPVGCGEEDGFMRWAVRLVTPPGGKVGDPWAGSGSTLIAAQIEGHDATGGDADPGACDITRARLAYWTPERHRLALQRPAALKALEQQREQAEQVGQRRLFEGL